MSDKGIKRRDFLQGSGAAAVGIAALSAGFVLAAPDGAWALEMKVLKTHASKTLLAMARATYPHDNLADFYYAKVVGDLDAAAAKDKALAKMLNEGVATLDKVIGVNFIDLSEGNQLKVLESIQTSGFFQKVRGTCIVSLYNQPLVWRHFGYEGSSAEHGGYIDRGFDDLNWLKRPPLDASPAAK
jgi:hypothetical protein